MVDNTSIGQQHRRDEDEFEEPIEDDLERREIYLDGILEEYEDIEIQELIRRLSVINETTPTTTATTTPSPTTTSATATTTTPPLITSPGITSGFPSYASACTVGSTVNPSRVSSACACLITNKAPTTTVTATATVTSGLAVSRPPSHRPPNHTSPLLPHSTHANLPTPLQPTTTLTVPGPITTVTATTYSSCSAEHYANYQQFNHTVPASVAHNYTYPNPDPSQHTKDACCNACYGSPNCFAFLYLASDAELGRGASCRIFGTDHTGNAKSRLTTAGTGRMCPAGEYYDEGIGHVMGVSGYEYGPCDEANAFRSEEGVE